MLIHEKCNMDVAFTDQRMELIEVPFIVFDCPHQKTDVDPPHPEPENL